MKETQVPVVYAYEGIDITFSKGDSVMINATEMAKPFGKRPVKWRMVKSLCLGVDLAESEDEEFCVVYAV